MILNFLNRKSSLDTHMAIVIPWSWTTLSSTRTLDVQQNVTLKTRSLSVDAETFMILMMLCLVKIMSICLWHLTSFKFNAFNLYLYIKSQLCLNKVLYFFACYEIVTCFLLSNWQLWLCMPNFVNQFDRVIINIGNANMLQFLFHFRPS